MSGVRKFAMPEHENMGRGWCRWCGLPTLHTEGPKSGTINYRRLWHPECYDQYRLHVEPHYQAAFLRQRDGAKCFDCAATTRDYRTELEVEHEIPLWCVTHLQGWERIRYFGPSNLRLRCVKCHAAKTKREAAARAKVNRLRLREENGPKPSRMRSRGFNRSLRKRMNGKVEAR